MPLNRLVPITLRLSTLGLRFILIFFLARYLPVSEVGLYGLLTVTISYALYPIGLDFYTYSTREFIQSDRGAWRGNARSQLTLAALMFTLLAPLFLLLFWLGLLPWWLAGWFFLLVALEYLSIEIDRMLIAIQDQTAASVVLFLGGGLTPLTVILLFTASPSLRSLQTLLAVWATFDVLAVIAGVASFGRHTRDSGPALLDTRWIRRGVQIATPLLIGTLSLRAIFTLDRQFLKLSAGLEVVGVYSFYMTLGMGITQLIYAGIHQFTYPVLIESYHRRDPDAFNRTIRSLIIQTVAALVCLSALVVALQRPLLTFVRSELYSKYWWYLPWILVAIALYNIGLIPHYILYATGADRWIVLSSIFGILAFIATALVLPHFGAGADVTIFASLITANTVILSIKLHTVRGVRQPTTAAQTP